MSRKFFSPAKKPTVYGKAKVSRMLGMRTIPQNGRSYSEQLAHDEFKREELDWELRNEK